MSDLADRVGVATGGNANLISAPGDLLTGDGEQCVYLRNPNANGDMDGLVLTLDSTVEEGISWQAGGGGGGGITNVTGADGIAVSTPSAGVRQVHNDLVTGVGVAQINMQTIGTGNMVASIGGDIQIVNGNTGAEVDLFGTAGPLFKAVAGGQKFEITALNVVNVAGASDINIQCTATGHLTETTADGDITLNANGGVTNNGDVNLTADSVTGTAGLSGGTAIITGANAVNINGATNATITVTTGGTGDLVANISHDETHNVGRNFAVAAAGSGGISLVTSHATAGNILLQTASGDIHLNAQWFTISCEALAISAFTLGVLAANCA